MLGHLRGPVVVNMGFGCCGQGIEKVVDFRTACAYAGRCDCRGTQIDLMPAAMPVAHVHAVALICAVVTHVHVAGLPV
ncbi:MAG: hypothetical protein AAFU34_13960, partial [Pseudomonadota bacterium]